MSTHHNPWPYPRNADQVIQAVIVSLIVMLGGLTVTAAWVEHYRNKALDVAGLQQAASSLSGYASEGAVEADEAAQGRSTQHYQRAYLQQLASETQQVTDFLHAHSAPTHVVNQRESLLQYGATLQRTLERGANTSQPDQLLQTQHDLTDLQTMLAQLENVQ